MENIKFSAFLICPKLQSDTWGCIQVHLWIQSHHIWSVDNIYHGGDLHSWTLPLSLLSIASPIAPKKKKKCWISVLLQTWGGAGHAWSSRCSRTGIWDKKMLPLKKKKKTLHPTSSSSTLMLCLNYLQCEQKLWVCPTLLIPAIYTVSSDKNTA